jgi:2-polyprenyl-3-methyl-5-hydroxy-6-metoxy-1,4-benzoquinol methylase
MPTVSELQRIYAAAYSAENIAEAVTDQVSDRFACMQYARMVATLPLARPVAVLDYGAGTGLLVELLRQRGFKAEGVEFSDAAREHCLRTRGISLLAPTEPLPKSTYSLVTMIEVIEHLTDLWRVLTDLRQCLVPGGRLLVTTPNARGFRALLSGGNWREARKKYHLLLFCWRSLRHHLAANGFANIRQTHFPPVVVRGLPRWVYGRGIQLIGMTGTLCVTATRSDGPAALSGNGRE